MGVWQSDYSEEEPVYTMHLVATNFKEFSTYGYITADGTEKGLPYWDDEQEKIMESDMVYDLGQAILRTDGTVYLTSNNGSYKLMTNVTSLSYWWAYDGNTLVMTRKDGTIWLFNPYENRIATPQKFSQKLLDEVYGDQNDKKDINQLAFSYQREMSFTGKEIKSTLTIHDYDYVLKPGKDYDVTYKNNINLGTATMVVTGKGDYTGTRNLTFTIKKASQTKKKQTIQGANKFTKTDGSKPFYLKAKTTGDGKLTYKSNNRNVVRMSQTGKATIKGPGQAVVTITAATTKNYNAATKKVTITVKPKTITGLKAKVAKKNMTVQWKRDAKASGYQLTYAQNSKFKTGKKNITIRKNKTTKKVIKNLKPKKTYYVKVRAYKKAGKTNVYGAYSKVSKMKIK